MADLSGVARGAGGGPPDPRDDDAFKDWLTPHPHEWSVVIAARAAARVLPLVRSRKLVPVIQPVFRAVAVAHFAAKSFRKASTMAAASSAASVAASAAAFVEGHTSRSTRNAGHTRLASVAVQAARYASAARAVSAASAAASAISPNTAQAYASAAASCAADASAYAAASAAVAIQRDAIALSLGSLSPEELATRMLWPEHSIPPFANQWAELCSELLKKGKHWSIWIDWYDRVLLGGKSSEDEDAAFTDMFEALPWQNYTATNLEIARRLRVIGGREAAAYVRNAPVIDPDPIEDVPCPISIIRRLDGRIGADAGLFSEPALPPSFKPADHAKLVEACSARAGRLLNQAASPSFQGRADYADALSQYLEWLPSNSGAGNVLLADGEARVLSKLFVAEQGILPTAFASSLSTLLEDHYGLRAYYPELERHYHSIRTGHLATPLPHDAVEGVRKIIHAHSPGVFDETVAPVMDETARPVPAVTPPLADDAPPPDPNRPKPPRDPIADIDPAASRNYIFASAANLIYKVLKAGKDVGSVAKGWNDAYEALRPYVRPLLDWLRNWLGGGVDGGPPTISA